MENCNLELIVEKKGRDYFTYLDVEDTILLIKDFFRKYEKCEAEVGILSCIAGRGINPDTGKPIIKGIQAFSATYNAGVNKRTGKTVIEDVWVEESNLKGMFKELFKTYGYEIKDIIFHTDLYFDSKEKTNNEEKLLIDEEMVSDYDSDNLRSTPVGVSILFGKKKTIFKEAALALKKINKKNGKAIA